MIWIARYMQGFWLSSQAGLHKEFVLASIQRSLESFQPDPKRNTERNAL